MLSEIDGRELLRLVHGLVVELSIKVAIRDDAACECMTLVQVAQRPVMASAPAGKRSPCSSILAAAASMEAPTAGSIEKSVRRSEGRAAAAVVVLEAEEARRRRKRAQFRWRQSTGWSKKQRQLRSSVGGPKGDRPHQRRCNGEGSCCPECGRGGQRWRWASSAYGGDARRGYGERCGDTRRRDGY